MKRLYDYTEEELRGLSDEQVKTLIDIECAYEGAPMLPECPVAPDYTRPSYDIEVYCIFGFYFKAPEEANSILTAFQKVVSYEQQGYSDDKRLSPISGNDYTYPKVVPQKMYSIETWDDIKNDIKLNEQIQSDYDSKKSIYNNTVKARADIADHTWEEIFNARNKEATRNTIRTSYKHYLNLAEQDVTIAMNFLIKSNPDVEDDLIQELCPGYEIKKEEDKDIE